MHTYFWSGNLKVADLLEYIDVDGKFIVNCLLKGWVDGDRIHLVQDRVSHMALVNIETNIRVLKKQRFY
jgi:hypothetical protein